MDAAGGDPCLHGNNRGGGIWIENEGESVREGVAGGVGERIFHEFFRLGGRMDGA